jgi:predicted DNA-binding transcriptional regulator YafY
MPRNFIKRFIYIDSLISQRSTGSPQILAEKIGVLERTAKEFISIMKELGAPICYDRYRKTYYYKFQGHFNISFFSGQRGCTVDK